MRKLRVGVYGFSESKAREEVYQKRSPLARAEVQKIITALEPFVEIIYPEPREIRTKKDVAAVTRQMYAAAVDAVVFVIPTFVVASQVSMAGCLMNIPPLLIGNRRGDTVSQTGLFAAGGALSQVGVAHRRIIGDLGEDHVLAKALTYLRGVGAASQLKGQTFGCVGGRSLGIVTTVADGPQWQRLFGVDIEHIDQSAVIRYAKSAGSDLVAKHVAWVKEKFGKVEIDDGILEKQLRSYIATKQLIEEYEVDFLGIKCQTDLSDWYCLQCLNVALIGDPYDAHGHKEPMVCSCEADHDGALTMQVLKLLSGGRPTALADLADASGKELVLANCGSSPTWFAGGSDDPERNTQDVHLLPHVFGKAGGASLQFVFREDEVTLARLCRKAGNYYMVVALGRTIEKPREELRKTGWVRPHAFVKSDMDMEKFVATFDSNHIHIAPGNLVSEVEVFCDTVGIPCKVL